MTKAEVLAIYDDVVSMLTELGEPKDGFAREAFRGTKSRVHAQLQLEKPPPYSDLPAHVKPQSDGTLKTRKEFADVQSHQRMQPTDAEHVAAGKARSGPDGSFVDTHHYVQREHGKALWVEAAKLVADAGITEAGPS